VPVVAKDKRYELCEWQDRFVRDWPGYGFGLSQLEVPLDIYGGADRRCALLALFVYDERPASEPGPPERIEPVIRAYLKTTDIGLLCDGVICQMPDPVEPPAASSDVTFAFGSCQYPYGAFDIKIASASYSRLNALVGNGAADKPKFLVLMGDQIYSDATGGLFDPTLSEDRYVLPYERWLRTTPVRSVLRQLPAYMMLDDHEIVDNWEPGEVPDRTRDEPVRLGRSAYLTYQRTLGPPVMPKCHTVHPLWYDTEPAVLPFFFVDSRTDRQPRTLSRARKARMLGKDQLRDLTTWLTRKRQDELQPKFIVSSSMLLPRKVYYVGGKAGAFRADSWQGYPATFYRLLARIADIEPQNLTFLSGDEHHSCVARITVKNLSRPSAKPVKFRSIHCSGLYSPFPFANGKPQDLLRTDAFTFKVAGQRYRCKVVSTKLIKTRDGFATIRCMRNGSGGWAVRCKFNQAR
jgi:cholesterol oxidase